MVSHFEEFIIHSQTSSHRQYDFSCQCAASGSSAKTGNFRPKQCSEATTYPFAQFLVVFRLSAEFDCFYFTVMFQASLHTHAQHALLSLVSVVLIEYQSHAKNKLQAESYLLTLEMPRSW